MTRLADKLPLQERRTEIINACQNLLEGEVRRKKGLGGMAVKAGYKVLSAIKPTAVPEVIDNLLNDFVDSLDSFHEDFESNPGASFGARLKQNTSEVAEALLSVTDGRAQNAKHKTMKKMYTKLRPSASRHVQEAIPGLADLMDHFYQD